jgi:glycosyltransferase involved in cell wall biosynthesis
MHILFLTDNFPPEVNAPASRTHEHCREWVAAGHEVTVITCAPNFPSGRVFAGYRNRLRQVETIDGIRVIRVWSYITANEGFVRRILDYVSFMVSAGFWGLFVRRADVVVGTSPQFFTVCAAWFLAAVKRVPFVFELRDLWPESIKAVGAMRDSLATRLLERLARFLYRRATRIVSVTHSFRDNLIAHGIDGGKVDVVTNGVDMQRFQARPKDAALLDQLGLTGKFVAGYVGTHGLAHGLTTLLDAAERLARLPNGTRFAIVLLGDGAEKAALRAEAQRRGLGNVLFIDSVPKAEVARYWSLLDVSIIHLRRTELFGTVIPSKLFEAMGMEIPVLHGVAGESAGIVEREAVGIVFESEDAAALCAALQRLAADPALVADLRKRCRAGAARYDRKALAAAMLGSLESAVRSGSRNAGGPGPVPPGSARR